MRTILTLFALTTALPAAAATCALSFTIEVTQGAGTIRPGTELTGQAEFTTQGSFRQEGGVTAHFATGHMRLGPDIEGPIWTLITTSRSFSTDLVGIYAHEVTGLSTAGIAFEGPMVLALYGAPGTRPEPIPPNAQAEWDALSLRRVLTLHAHGQDMLAGDVTDLTAACSET